MTIHILDQQYVWRRTTSCVIDCLFFFCVTYNIFLVWMLRTLLSSSVESRADALLWTCGVTDKGMCTLQAYRRYLTEEPNWADRTASHARSLLADAAALLCRRGAPVQARLRGMAKHAAHAVEDAL